MDVQVFNSEGVEEGLQLVALSKADIPRIMQLQESIGAVGSPAFTKFEDGSFYCRALGEKAWLWGIENEEKVLLASMLMTFPGLSRLNLGYELAYEDAQLRLTAQFEGVLVHPRYSDQGLDVLLFTFLGDKALSKGFHNFTALACSQDYPMILSLMDAGLSMRKFILANDSKPLEEGRYIFAKESRNDALYGFVESWPLSCIEDIAACLEKGYRGYLCDGAQELMIWREEL